MQVELMELELSYLNTLAQHFIFISAFLGGFSAAILGTLIVSDINTKYSRIMIISSVLAAMCFVVTVFGMTGILFQTTEGYPMKIDTGNLITIRIISIITLILGLLSFIVCMASSGWLINKKIGRFTTILGIIAFILIISMMG